MDFKSYNKLVKFGFLIIYFFTLYSPNLPPPPSRLFRMSLHLTTPSLPITKITRKNTYFPSSSLFLPFPFLNLNACRNNSATLERIKRKKQEVVHAPMSKFVIATGAGARLFGGV